MVIIITVQAVSSCTTICCSGPNRYTVLSSGILPALAKIATGKSLTDILKHSLEAESHKKVPESLNDTLECTESSSSPPMKKTNMNNNNHNIAGDTSSSLSTIDSSAKTAEKHTQDDDLFQNNILTPAHATFLQCCILSSQYLLASKFAKQYPVYLLSENQSILAVPNLQRITSETFLTYFYYLGMVHIGNNDYRGAISAFHICLTTPAKDISAVVIAAQKKSLLARCCLTAEDLEDDELTDDGMMENNNDESRVYCKSIPSSKLDRSSKAKKISKKIAKERNESLSNIENFDLHNQSMKSSPLRGKLAQRILKIPDFVCNEVNKFLEDASRSKYRKDFNNILETNDYNENYATAKLDKEVFEKNYHCLPHYHDLVAAFCSFDITSYETYLDRDKLLLESDGNWGLAKRLISVMKRIFVRKLTKVYKVIRLKTLADLLQIRGGPKEAERLLLGIAWKEQEKQLHGGLVNNLISVPLKFRIDMENEIVYFPKENEESEEPLIDECFHDADTENVQLLLRNRVISLMEMADRVQNLDIALVTSSRFQTLFSSKGPQKSDNNSDCGVSGPCGVTDLT